MYRVLDRGAPAVGPEAGRARGSVPELAWQATQKMCEAQLIQGAVAWLAADPGTCMYLRRLCRVGAASITEPCVRRAGQARAGHGWQCDGGAAAGRDRAPLLLPDPRRPARRAHLARRLHGALIESNYP
jgi:hypothetical protein